MPEPCAWLTVNVATGKPYNLHHTEAEAENYRAQVHQSNDSLTLRIRPVVWAD